MQRHHPASFHSIINYIGEVTQCQEDNPKVYISFTIIFGCPAAKAGAAEAR
jgi:hypothetical protein